MAPALACSSFSPTPGVSPQHASCKPSSIPLPAGDPSCMASGATTRSSLVTRGTLEAPKFFRRKVPCRPLLTQSACPGPRLHGRLLPRRSGRSQGPSHWAAPPTPQSLQEKETVCLPPGSHVEALTPTPQVQVPTEPSREGAPSGRNIPNPGSALWRKNTSCQHLAAQPWEEGLNHSPLRLL